MSAPSSHRRSRHGCTTCRTARIKCDEKRPTCDKCTRRRVHCGGYPVELKWVEASDISPDAQAPARSVVKARSSIAMGPSAHAREQRAAAASAAAAAMRGPAKVPLPRSPSARGPVRNDVDALILSHWARQLPELVYADTAEQSSVRDPYLAFVYRPDSLLLPATLAAGASHLYAAGVLKQADAFERKQRALNRVIACVRQHRSASAAASPPAVLPFYVSEEAVAASLCLVGLEIMLGSHTDVLQPLIRGAKAQVDERRRITRMAKGRLACPRPTIMLGMNIKMLAWMDTFSCVPCARRPVLDRKFWTDEVLPLTARNPRGHPDLVFGLSTDMFALIGSAATLVQELLGGTATREAFAPARAALLRDLVQKSRELPRPTFEPYCRDGADASSSVGALKIRSKNACIAAARAHSLATQIFLLRADDGEDDTTTTTTTDPLPRPSELAEELLDAIVKVPIDTHASTLMLWPVFALGCESVEGSPWRPFVEAQLRRMFAKERLLNITVALDALRSRIWKVEGVRRLAGGGEDGRSTAAGEHARHSPEGPEGPEGWVRQCWREKLQLCMA
ncbi:Sterol uptake control protein 2 [Colletotrichum trifolii]|uniref:Sterol uptake control protein 2 n=1 Tax=Colletotrichum trifolii TaxID=5466 RepID=A0A4R8QGR3_COLTR|nr:Sterol uptake control protein 2 [Colletotrichum trifolii]